MKKYLVLLLVLVGVLGYLPDGLAGISERISPYLGRTYVHHGANCWGTVLFSLGLRPVFSYAGDKEFSHVMKNSGRCRSLHFSEQVIEGDVGSIAKENELLHAFVYLDSKNVITKADTDPNSPVHRSTEEKEKMLYSDAKLERFRCEQGSFEGITQTEKEDQIWETIRRLALDWISGRTLSSLDLDRYLLEIQSLWNYVYTHGGAENNPALLAYIDSISWQLAPLPFSKK